MVNGQHINGMPPRQPPPLGGPGMMQPMPVMSSQMNPMGQVHGMGGQQPQMMMQPGGQGGARPGPSNEYANQMARQQPPQAELLYRQSMANIHSSKVQQPYGMQQGSDPNAMGGQQPMNAATAAMANRAAQQAAKQPYGSGAMAPPGSPAQKNAVPNMMQPLAPSPKGNDTATEVSSAYR